jgi:predicted RNA-binding Zn-ribbon protein involved in translation (DUF1610 family)
MNGEIPKFMEGDHITLEYKLDYYHLIKTASEKVGLTYEQGLGFLHALYDNKEEERVDREGRTMYICTAFADKGNLYRCEKCGFEVTIEGMIDEWDYCPKCGADIDSWQELDEKDNKED